MKKKYLILKFQTKVILICSILFAGTVSYAQNKSITPIEKAEKRNTYVRNLIYKGLVKQTAITSEQLYEFQRYYLDTLGNDLRKEFQYFKNNPNPDTTEVRQYVSTKVEHYTQMYNKFKQVKTEFPSSVEEILNPPKYHHSTGTCNGACDNVDFSSGTLAAWTECYATCQVEDVACNTSSANASQTPPNFGFSAPVCGTSTNTNGAGPDPNTGNDYQVTIVSPGADPVSGLPMVCPAVGGNPAYSYAARIGDGTTVNWGVAQLEQTFMVTAANTDFYYNYSVYLENPGHCYHQQPYFNVAMIDQNNDTIPHCGNYNVVAGGSNVTGAWITPAGSDFQVLPWTTAFVSLKKYIGQCVTIIIQTSDCGQGGHAGYAYFDASCKALGIITSAPALCGNPIQLTAPSGGLTYQWKYTGTGTNCITPAAGNTQTITVGCPGKYTVVITTVSGASCADTLDTVITSSTGTAPKPDFHTDTVCAGNPTTFKNLSTGGGPGNKYLWTFVSPITSTSDTITTFTTGTSPTFTYPAAGNYTATLSATNGGCGGDTVLPVVVIGPPTAAFTANTVCLNTPTAFTNTSTPTTGPFSWNFGDGGTSTVLNPTHTYTVCGTYKVVLTVGVKGCIAKDSTNVIVNPNPVPNFTADTVCINGGTQFTDKTTITCGGSITGWSWKFGDPPTNGTSTVQNPTYTYSAIGNYNVTLTSTSNNGCQNAVTLPVEVVGQPTVAFNVAPVCVGQAATFNNTSTGATTWKWTFGDPANGTSTVKNPSYTYLTAGTYTVKLVASTGAGCVDSTTNTITVNPSPVGAATASTVCQGTGTVFTNTTTGAATYKWSFGDTPPGTSTTASPTYTYSVAGSYTATLISTSANGCTDTIKVPVVVNPNPTGTFTVPPVCLGTASVFTLTTTNMAGGTYAWAFGDAPTNGTSAVQNPTYTYGTTGTFNVSVVLTTSAGCTGNATGTALVNPIPVPNFTAPPVCSDQAMVFTNTSIPATGATYAWNFGDGSTSSSASPTHQYAACGTYNVMLTVTSGTNCVHDTTITVTINPVPVPNFTATTECPGFATTFTDKSTISCGGTITGWSWSFGDGSGTSTVQNPTYTYKASGIYQVSLKVTSNNGCDSIINLPVTVYPIPVPGFTATAPCQGVATNFTDTSKVAGGIITGWSWRFGDPANGTAGTQNPSYTYASAGAYNVTLVVTSSNGCIDSVTEQVLVHPNPVPAFVSDTAFCTPKCITDTNLSTVSPIPPPVSSINAWAWNFGDGSPDSISDLKQPNHCYTKPGTYTVSLTITTNFGCTATLVKPNYVTAWPVPVAKFAANPNPTVLVDNPTVVFTDQSTGNPVSWSWFNFGDGKDSLETTENTTHTYTDTGTFVVYLAIKNKFGCVDTTDVPVIVQPVWTFYVPNAFTPNGDGINDGFIGKGVGILSYEMWIFDRWGMQLYHCTSMSQPWDGTVQGGSGQKCEEDTYVWLIQIVDVFHDSHRYVGRVSIIK